MSNASMHPAVELARELIRIDTAAGNESAAAAVIAPRLERAGLRVERHELAAGRESLVASVGSPRVTLSGHLDTVPFDRAGWSVSPTGAVVQGDRLFGRGASDMKSGVAAMVVAAERHLERPHRCTGLQLVLSAGEEVGCLGARELAELEAIGGEMLVVGEPTGNQMRLGHKGAVWFEVAAHGKAAHGAQPELGHNAILELARVAVALTDGFPRVEHPELGRATINVGSLHGGTQPNLVPDEALMAVDVRTVPGFDPAVVEELAGDGSGHIDVRRVVDAPAVWSESSLEPVRRAATATGQVAGDAVPYFTDASLLSAAYEATIVLGPGDLDQMHTVDESCSIGLIEQAVEIYGALLDAWCG